MTNRKPITIIALSLAAVFLVSIGIFIGKNDASVLSLVSIATQTPSPTITQTATQTSTPTSTRTLLPTKTSTPTLAPGEFPLSASKIRENFSTNLGIHCLEPTLSKDGGYFWDCQGMDGNNMMRVIFYGQEQDKIDCIYSWVLNTYDPSPWQTTYMFHLLTKNVFSTSLRPNIDSAISALTQEIFDNEVEFVTDTINGFPITITGPGICRVLVIGTLPSQEIDRDIIPLLGELENFCY